LGIEENIKRQGEEMAGFLEKLETWEVKNETADIHSFSNTGSTPKHDPASDTAKGFWTMICRRSKSGTAIGFKLLKL
jgi:hypothetical protein